MTTLQHVSDAVGGVRVTVRSDRIDADELVFIFTHEGLIIDAFKDDLHVGTSATMYEDIEAVMLEME